MKTIIIILSICCVVILSDPKDTAAVSSLFLTMIQPTNVLPIYAYDDYRNSTKYIDEFLGGSWNITNKLERPFRTERALRNSARMVLKAKEDEDEFHFMAQTKAKHLVTEEDVLKLRRAYVECMDKTFVKIKLIIQFKAGNWNEHPSLSEWALCVLVKMGLMSPQGVYQYDAAMSKISFNDKYEVDKIIKRCIKPLSPQKIAWRYLKCINKKDWKKQYPYLGIFYSL